MQRKYLLGSNQNELRLEPEAHLVTKFTLLKPTRPDDSPSILTTTTSHPLSTNHAQRRQIRLQPCRSLQYSSSGIVETASQLPVA
jgi:hypothetical protein